LWCLTPHTLFFIFIDYHPFAIADAPNVFRQGGEVIDQDIYERRFLVSTYEWAAYPDFSLTVTADDASKSYYYLCLIHHGMEGAIKVLSGDSTLTAVSSQEESGSSAVASIREDTRSEFDKKCGTYGLGNFQLPNNLCPDHFICGTDEVTEELQQFAACLDAANCAMMSGMTTGVQATADSALFIHQMIPHHENAVNTAKTLLKTGNLLCPDLTDQSNPDCELEGILLGIIAGQNHQIQLMRSFLSNRQYPQEDNCDVFVKTVEDPAELPMNEAGVNLDSAASLGVISWAIASLVLTLVWGFTLW